MGDLAAFIGGLPDFDGVVCTQEYLQSVAEAALKAGLVTVKSERTEFYIPRRISWGR